MHEILALQFGNLANHVATHFWNTQESYFTYSENEIPLVNHDIHFRPGVAADGSDTFTPRTVIYDLKGGFGSLRKFNALYEVQEETPLPRGLWSGQTALQRQAPIEPTEYQKNLEQGLPTFQLTSRDVRYWSDFNRVFYHPRSIVQLNEYELNSQTMPFESWAAGQELFQNLDKEADLIDRDFRPFAEECDQLQGIQVFSGTDNAWGGFLVSYLDGLRDEFGKTSVWVWGLEDGRRVSRQKQILQTINTARAIQSLARQASAYIRTSTLPSSLPEYVNLDPLNDWTTSALMVTAIETVTLPTRLRQVGGRQASLPLLENILNTNGRQNLFELAASVPQLAFSTQHHRSADGEAPGISNRRAEEPLLDMSRTERKLDIEYTTRLSQRSQGTDAHIFSQVVVQRGQTGNSERANTTDHMMGRETSPDTVVEQFYTALKFPLLETFPRTLFPRLDPQNQSMGVEGSLTTSSNTRSMLGEMRQLIGRYLKPDEREVLLSDLSEIGDAYAHGWRDSDSGEDD